MILDFVVKPFGKTLNQDLLEIFIQKLDLNEALIKELKASANEGARK